ncbi:MAG: polysaccharide biosynthesis protein [Firmicutes bacterium]|nr:polysaccharide biosynthesis protein [Bacillota bacterium]
MKRNFLKAAGVLTLGVFLAKIVGAFYRIPLTNILGAEGMGVYQLIFPVYSFLLATSSGALPLAISVMVSERVTRGEEDEARVILNSAMSVLLLTGVVISLALALLSAPLARLQGNSDASLGYLAIAPAIFFVSGIAVLRGWFQGHNNMVPSASSNVIEAVIKLASGLLLAYFLLPYGIKWAVFGALIGVTASEAVAFLALYALYRKDNGRFRLNLDFKDARSKYKEIVKISLPITLGGMIFPFSQIIDSFLVVNLLSSSLGSQVATAGYGVYTGVVTTIINLPIVLALSLGIAIIPQLTKGKAEGDIVRLKMKLNTAVKTALTIGVPFAILFLAIPRGIIGFLYPALSPSQLAEATLLLRITAISTVGLALTQIYTAILQGLGNLYAPMKIMGVGVGVKTVLTIALIPFMGIAGVAVASATCFLITATLNGMAVRELTGKNADIGKNGSVILASGAIMCVGVVLVNYLVAGRLATVLTAVAGALIYGVLLLFFNAFSDSELLSLPLGKQILRFATFLRRRRGNQRG